METNFIKHLLRNQTLDTDRVLEVVSLATYENQESILRIMSYLTGFSSLPKFPEHPTNEKWKFGEDAHFISYNVVTNEVTYECRKSREFKVSNAYIRYDGCAFTSFCDIPHEIRVEYKDGQPITVDWWEIHRISANCWI